MITKEQADVATQKIMTVFIERCPGYSFEIFWENLSYRWKEAILAEIENIIQKADQV